MAGPAVHSVRRYHHDAVTVRLAYFPHDSLAFCSLFLLYSRSSIQVQSLYPSCCLINSNNNNISCVLWFFFGLLAVCSQSECIPIIPGRFWPLPELQMADWAHFELSTRFYGLYGLFRLSLAPIQPFFSRLYLFVVMQSPFEANHIASSLHSAATTSSSVCSSGFNLLCLAPHGLKPTQTSPASDHSQAKHNHVHRVGLPVLPGPEPGPGRRPVLGPLWSGVSRSGGEVE